MYLFLNNLLTFETKYLKICFVKFMFDDLVLMNIHSSAKYHQKY